MKHIYIGKKTLAIGLALFVTACEQADNGVEWMTPVVVAEASVSTGSGVISRALTDTKLSDLTLYYPNRTGVVTPYAVAAEDITQTALALDIKTNGDATTKPLYWQFIDGKGATAQDFYLTVKQQENDWTNVLWAKATSTAATAGAEPAALAFGKLVNRYACLVVKFNNKLDKRLLSAHLFVKEADTEAAAVAAIAVREWPTVGSVKKRMIFTPTTASEEVSNLEVSMLLAPQGLPTAVAEKIIVVTYNAKDNQNYNANEPTVEGALDLSTLTVNRTESDKSFSYKAGERLTLTLSLFKAGFAVESITAENLDFKDASGNIDIQ